MIYILVIAHPDDESKTKFSQVVQMVRAATKHKDEADVYIWMDFAVFWLQGTLKIDFFKK